MNLCFHGIGTPGRPLEDGEADCWLEVAQFEEVLSVVRRYPFFRISFDDGNASDVATALPALLKYNLTATFFIVASRLDQPGSLTSEDVGQLVRSGMKIGSHGMFHRPWRSVTDDHLRAELSDATRVIGQVADVPVREVACPFGSYDRRVLGALRRHGFTRVYTVDGGCADETAWLQPRYSVCSRESPIDIERLARSPSGSMVSSALLAGKTLIKRFR